MPTTGAQTIEFLIVGGGALLTFFIVAALLYWIARERMDMLSRGRAQPTEPPASPAGLHVERTPEPREAEPGNPT